ncbi:hypothetical protein U3516DRAFT_739684 [Neocallimastix sp. 'constans']
MVNLNETIIPQYRFMSLQKLTKATNYDHNSNLWIQKIQDPEEIYNRYILKLHGAKGVEKDSQGKTILKIFNLKCDWDNHIFTHTFFLRRNKRNFIKSLIKRREILYYDINVTDDTVKTDIKAKYYLFNNISDDIKCLSNNEPYQKHEH